MAVTVAVRLAAVPPFAAYLSAADGLRLAFCFYYFVSLQQCH